MAQQFLDLSGLQLVWEKIKSYIYLYTYNKEKLYTKDETYSSEEIDSKLGSINSKINNVVFIGKRAEYDEAYSNNLIAVNTLVVITDDGGSDSGSDDNAGDSAVLGAAVLGKMILGKS